VRSEALAEPVDRHEGVKPQHAPMRILLVVEATEGGLGRHVLDLAEGLVEAKHAVLVAASPTRMEAGFRTRLSSLEARGVESRSIPMPRSVKNPLADLRALTAVTKVAREWRPDLIHGHSSKGGAYARQAGVLLGVPSAYTPNAFVFASGAQTLGARAFVFLERMLGRVTDLLLCVSESERAIALQHRIGADHVAMVPNGVELPTAAHQAGGASRRPLSVLSVGRLADQKDPLLWAEIVLEAARRAPGELQFRWAGEGPLRGEVEARLASGSAGTGVLLGHRTDVPDLLRATDVVLMTSRFEGLPYALLDAMALGAPCVARRCPGVTELLDRDDAGVLVTGTDPRAFVDALVGLARDPARRDRVGAAAREAVRARYSLDAMIRGTVDAYAAVLGKRRATVSERE
jgi:glycosyltransferase involved in cell wall biosynthesis